MGGRKFQLGAGWKNSERKHQELKQRRPGRTKKKAGKAMDDAGKRTDHAGKGTDDDGKDFNSIGLEEPLLDQAQTKMRDLQDSILELEATTGTRPGAMGPTKSVGGASTGMTITFALSELSSGSGGQGSGPPVGGSGAQAVSRVDLSFIRDAVRELLRCRRVLKASYCYGYYLQGLLSTKQFEYMQGGLEQVTEMLAEAVARPHLRKPHLEIICLTREAREKRAALVKQVREGFPSSSGPFLPSASFVESMEPPHLHHLFMDLDSYQPPSHSRRERTNGESLKIRSEK